MLVRTEESWDGEEVRAQAGMLQETLDGSLHGWLKNLKSAADNASNPA